MRWRLGISSLSSDLAPVEPATPVIAWQGGSSILGRFSRRAHGPVGSWLTLTLFGAGCITILDAILLERKKGFLTGGFLAEDHLTTSIQFVSFMAASIVADAAIVGVFVALGLWLCAPLRQSRRDAAVLIMAITPLVIADFISYQLLAYLGDAFDLSLMYELVDGQSSEIFAVASGPLTVPLLVLIAALAATVTAVWRLNRRIASRQSDTTFPRFTDARLPIALFIGGAVVTATLSATDDVLENGLRRKPSGSVLNYLTGNLSDFDGDGYAAIGRLADPAPFDARVFPFAVDIPGNDLDEDGVAGDLPAGLPPYAESQSRPTVWSRRPDVVLIMLESFRADLLGTRQNGRAVTPTLDALASRGVSARLAYSHNGYTVQSRHHVFSGTIANLGDRQTLIDDFKAHGYETAWVSGQDESFGADDLEVGFERADVAYDARSEPQRRYSTFTTPGSLAVSYKVVVEQIGTFLESREPERPLFLYVNFHDTHFPYHHGDIRSLVNETVVDRHQIAPTRAADVRAMYANTVTNIDAAIAQVLQLTERSLGRKPAVLVIGDHGESLFDENFLGHGYALNDAQTRIPFIVANLPMVIEEPFGQSDLRASLWAAVEGTNADFGSARPVLRQNPDKAVFQYLGNIDRPRQIALVTLTDRLLFDFRTGKARVGNGVWLRPEHMAGVDRERVIHLVHTWERMKLARAGARRQNELDTKKGAS